MHAAQVVAWGKAPRYATVPDPPAPDDASGQIQIHVQATGLHQVVRARAAGGHYTASTLPHIPGTDGVGVTVDGRSVYFNALAAGGATFAEIVNVGTDQVFELPETLAPAKAAALVNPTLSSWMALRYRADRLPDKFTILIVGATSASGKIARAVAKGMGAGKVYGSARDPSALPQLGFDKGFSLTEYPDVNDVDVILDYVYGETITALFDALPANRPIQYIQIGTLSGQAATPIVAATLRSKNLTLRGAGPGAWDPRSISHEMPSILEMLARTELDGFETHPLSEVATHWDTKSRERQVFTL